MSFPVARNVHSFDMETKSLISTRYKRITRAINLTFWNTDSETQHSFYVGSYGRGTAIDSSDLDVLVELPDYEFIHFSRLTGNGQSRLLQVVKNSILTTYSQTDIRGDGQVVVVQFSDGMKFEILPAFKSIPYLGSNSIYRYPDTHMGGNWMSTNPKAEQDAMREKNRITNGLLYDTCKHIRFIRDRYFSRYHLSGILIDSFVYEIISGWNCLWNGATSAFGVAHRESFEEYLLKGYNDMSVYGLFLPQLKAPGSNMTIDANQGWKELGEILKFMA